MNGKRGLARGADCRDRWKVFLSQSNDSVLYGYNKGSYLFHCAAPSQQHSVAECDPVSQLTAAVIKSTLESQKFFYVFCLCFSLSTGRFPLSYWTNSSLTSPLTSPPSSWLHTPTTMKLSSCWCRRACPCRSPTRWETFKCLWYNLQSGLSTINANACVAVHL